jgi:ABC-2 type transport system permease protein
MNTTATISTIHAAVAGHPTRDRRHDVAAVPDAVKSEWIKLRSLRSTPAVLAATVIIGFLLSWIVGTFVKTDPYTDQAFTISQAFIFSTILTAVLAAIMGTLSFTSEVQHGTLAGAVAARPARWVIVVAKAAIVSSYGLVMGVAGMLAGYVGAVLAGLDTGDTSGVPSTIAWALLLTATAPLLGLGIGMILKHGSIAISVLLVWSFVLENLIRGFAPVTVSRLLPFTAANGLLGIRSAGDTDETIAAALTKAQDALLFGGYVVAALAIGTVLLARRDPN